MTVPVDGDSQDMKVPVDGDTQDMTVPVRRMEILRI